MATDERLRIAADDNVAVERPVGEALADAYARGVQDTLDRLASDEAVRCVIRQLGEPGDVAPSLRPAYESCARRILDSLAAALSPERRETT